MHGIWHIVATSAQRLATAQPGYAAAALTLYVVSLFIAGARWRGFLRALGADAGVVRATLATLGGIAAGNLAPPPAGEACRIALLRSGGRGTWQQATVAAIWDRLSEVPPILGLGAMAIVAARSMTAGWRPQTVAGGLAVLLALAGIAWSRTRRSGAWSRWRAQLARHRVSGGVFTQGVAFSSLLWLQDYLRLTCVTLAFGVALAPTQIAALCIVAMLGGAVPGVAGLGPVEGGLVAGLVAFGVDVPTAAAITALERIISYGFSTSAGAVVIGFVGGAPLWKAARGRYAPESEADAARS
ncbi:MAG: hypothetical protein JWL71_858 [Acidobacteria bacterium]|nr:hypothetical protein [Acidobacteriota bacterium]